jgi:hypothetical protein
MQKQSRFFIVATKHVVLVVSFLWYKVHFVCYFNTDADFFEFQNISLKTEPWADIIFLTLSLFLDVEIWDLNIFFFLYPGVSIM